MGQQIPNVFRLIMENDTARKAIGSESMVTDVDRRRYASLRKDKRNNLVPSAEKMLKWNTDKGAS